MRVARIVQAGGFAHVEPVFIGGDYPVVIQTMWKDRLSFEDLKGSRGKKILVRIDRLRKLGCGLLRFAVPTPAAAEALGELASRVSLPLTADIHFDYKIALRCLDFPIAKIRINPGNIGSRDRVEQVLAKAATRGVPLRIGVNAGSLPGDLQLKVDSGELSRALALVEAAERELAFFKEFNFQAVLVSMKASGIADTIEANRILASRTDVPLHIGVTEAGPLIAGVVRNTAALCSLLGGGIGDTIRVSLSDTMENEVIAGREILNAVIDSSMSAVSNGVKTAGGDTAADGKTEEPGFRRAAPGVTIVSCPRCGRNSFDTHSFTRRWMDRLYALDKNLTVAIMGCPVNGPGEGRHADLGITGVGDKVILFRRGQVIGTASAAEADEAFAKELEHLSGGGE
jgi:(E)-4-hydroxy-3-methylbut-2-enyl-diphosphate synthase